jgi:solute carrier family 10 (sodium/bile acid cotransporter), member 7
MKVQRRILRLIRVIRQNWFIVALVGICVLTLIDVTGTIAGMGKWFKAHNGADAVICTIFLCSGLILKREEIRAGLRDIRGAVIALVIIFAIAPLVAFIIGSLPLDPAVRVGLFLVSVMPTTMSSGVVMTGAAGGNIAHALLITVLANSMSIVTIPFSLALLLQTAESVPFDKVQMMIQMALLVLLPLLLGLFLRPKKGTLLTSLQRGIPVLNQCLILAIVWMGVSDARATVLSSGAQVFIILVIAFVFHAILLGAGFLAIRLFHIPRGRMESVLFMGGQKTLPLSVLLQGKLFPQYGMALAFCVFHHFIHLTMDGYLVGRIKSAFSEKFKREPVRGG